MNEQKLIDEIKKLAKQQDIITGFFNGREFIADGGATYPFDSLILTNSQPGQGFLVKKDDKWLCVVGNGVQVTRTQIITDKRKKRTQEKDFTLEPEFMFYDAGIPGIYIYVDTSGSLDYLVQPIAEAVELLLIDLIPIFGTLDLVKEYVSVIYDPNEDWVNWLTPKSNKSLLIAIINESNDIYHTHLSEPTLPYNEHFENFKNAYLSLPADAFYFAKMYIPSPIEDFDVHINKAFNGIDGYPKINNKSLIDIGVEHEIVNGNVEFISSVKELILEKGEIFRNMLNQKLLTYILFKNTITKHEISIGNEYYKRIFIKIKNNFIGLKIETKNNSTIEPYNKLVFYNINERRSVVYKNGELPNTSLIPSIYKEIFKNYEEVYDPSQASIRNPGVVKVEKVYYQLDFLYGRDRLYMLEYEKYLQNKESNIPDEKIKYKIFKKDKFGVLFFKKYDKRKKYEKPLTYKYKEGALEEKFKTLTLGDIGIRVKT